jgi:hypothetical protein
MIVQQSLTQCTADGCLRYLVWSCGMGALVDGCGKT